MDERNQRPHRISISYDHNTDTLYISFLEAKNTVSRDQGNGILIQYNSENNSPIGAIVHDFEQRFANSNKPYLDLPLFSKILQSA